jgi:hypothetical protein
MSSRKRQQKGVYDLMIISSAPALSTLQVLSQTNMCDLISSWLELGDLASMLPVCKAITVSEVAWEAQCAPFPLIRLAKAAANGAGFGAPQPFRELLRQYFVGHKAALGPTWSSKTFSTKDYMMGVEFCYPNAFFVLLTELEPLEITFPLLTLREIKNPDFKIVITLLRKRDGKMLTLSPIERHEGDRYESGDPVPEDLMFLSSSMRGPCRRMSPYLEITEVGASLQGVFCTSAKEQQGGDWSSKTNADGVEWDDAITADRFCIELWDKASYEGGGSPPFCALGSEGVDPQAQNFTEFLDIVESSHWAARWV